MNPFEWMLDEGRMIKSVAVDTSDEYDDDWLVFEFGEPDPAISKLRSEDDQKT
ncbi:MAG: hypothetical protein QOC81_4535 [Thermoanaerobaculia bacterium]|nr:hypothetical protein [Thermoanaerobaculia bacterium]